MGPFRFDVGAVAATRRRPVVVRMVELTVGQRFDVEKSHELSKLQSDRQATMGQAEGGLDRPWNSQNQAIRGSPAAITPVPYLLRLL